MYTPDERVVGDLRVIIKPEQSSGTCKTAESEERMSEYKRKHRMPRRLTQTAGSRWMGVQGGDDKKQPLRRDGITTIHRRTTAVPSHAFTPALDFNLIPPRIIVPRVRLCSYCFVSAYIMSFSLCSQLS